MASCIGPRQVIRRPWLGASAPWAPLRGLPPERLPCSPKHYSGALCPQVSFSNDASYFFTQTGPVPSQLPPGQTFQKPGLDARPCGKLILGCIVSSKRLFVDRSKAIKDNGQCQYHCRMAWIQSTERLVISDHLFFPKQTYSSFLKYI